MTFVVLAALYLCTGGGIVLWFLQGAPPVAGTREAIANLFIAFFVIFFWPALLVWVGALRAWVWLGGIVR